MNNTVLRIISALLALGALAVGLLAFRLSQAPSPAPATGQASTPSIPLTPAAVATRGLKAGQPILAADVAIKGVANPPAQAYRDIQDVAGRVPVADIAAGTPLVPGQFAADSISYLLKPGERAVGIQVDEVSSVGGFVKPGEHVDVLAFVPSNDRENVSSASTLIQDARVLTIGDASKLDSDAAGRPEGVGTAIARESGVKTSLAVQDRRLNLKSAVIAVREADASKLMLAASLGSLRLALRPPEAFDPNTNLNGNDARRPKPGTSGWATYRELTARRPEDDSGKGIVIQEGSAEHAADTKNKLY